MKLTEEISCTECSNSKTYDIDIETDNVFIIGFSTCKEEIIKSLPYSASEVVVASVVKWEVNNWTEGRCPDCVDKAFGLVDEFGNRYEVGKG